MSSEYFIIENQCFPTITYIKYLFEWKYIVFLSSDRYKKMSFRNRYLLLGSTGLICLSVPLVSGRDQKIPFKDVRICYRQNWQRAHWHTITSCYNRSPFFEFYRDDLEFFFLNRWEFLFDWNLAILEWLKKVLAFPARIIRDVPPGEHINDFRNRYLPKNFREFSADIRYNQVFEERIGFQNNVSVIDLLLNAGPAAKDFFIKASVTDRIN